MNDNSDNFKDLGNIIKNSGIDIGSLENTTVNKGGSVTNSVRKYKTAIADKKDAWSNMNKKEKMDSIIELSRKYLIKPLILFISIVIIVTVAKYIRGLYKKYPRAFTFRNFLDISGKYDKSTGLDIELAESLSRALADYIYMPPKIIHDINTNSRKIIKDDKTNFTSDDSCKKSVYVNYLHKNLFDKFNIKNENLLYKRLRCLIEKGDEIFNKAYQDDIDEKEFKTNNKFKREYDNSFFINYFNNSKNLSKKVVNKYLIDYYKNISFSNPDYEFVNTKLDSETIKNFFKELDNCTNSVNINTKMEISYNDTVDIFNNILKTSSTNTDYNENVKDVFKNIFLRNVLYYIINQSNQSNKIISNHLEDLENNNIISYIDPRIHNNDSDGIYLFEKYGKYLYLKDDNDKIKSFNDIIDNSKINNEIYQHIKTPLSPTTADDIDNDIMSNIKNKITKLNIGCNNTGFIKSLKYTSKNEVFKILKKYKKNDNSNFDYNEEYNQFKSQISNVKTKYKKSNGHNTGNQIINELNRNNNGKISDKFNINKVDDNDKCILEIYTTLYMLEKMVGHVNDGINSEEFSNYLYYLEKYTTLKYYNSDTNKYEFLFEKDHKLKFIKYFIDIQEDLLYIRDKDLINTSLFLTLIYNKSSQNEINNDLLLVSRFYMSFTELKLADNFINDIKEYKENRAGYNVLNDYVLPKIKYLFVDIIIKKFLWEQWDIEKMKEMGKPFGSTMVKKLTNECVWFSTPLEKEIMSKVGIDCKEGMVVEHMFGFLKGLTKLPGLFVKMPKMLESFIKLIAKIFQFGYFLIRIFGYIAKLGLFGLVMLFIKTLFYICVLLVSVFLYFPFIFIWVAPLIILLLSGRRGNPTWILSGGTKLQSVINIFMWIMFAMFVDSPIIDMFGVFAYSIILLIITIFKSLIIFVIIFILLIIGLVILIIDSSLPNKGGFSRFLYKYAISCENSPFAWYKNSRYDLENKCSRGFFCNLNCGTNYRLSENGMYCEKAPTNVPYYCPQPLLYKTYKDDKINGKRQILSFFINKYPNILLSSPDKQLDFIFNYQKDKSEYYQKCNTFANGDGKTSKKGYNAIGKSVCASANNIKDKDIKENIKHICRQTYCSNGKYENFCYKYEENEKNFKALKFLDNKNVYVDILKKILFVAVLIALVNYLIILIKKSKKGEKITYNYKLDEKLQLKLNEIFVKPVTNIKSRLNKKLQIKQL